MRALNMSSLTTVIVLLMIIGQALPGQDWEATIDELVNISSPDVGYSQLYTGSNFVMYEESRQLGMLILGSGEPQTSSPVIKKLVAGGPQAVPHLLKHLSDARPVKLPKIEAGGFMWIGFYNEYDYNRATLAQEPAGVNVEHFGERDRVHPNQHVVTVGDLCFVALGQIVNRNWSATRYQPTGGRIINSPTYSKELCTAILDEWGKLDALTHRQKLIDDFKRCDSESRLIGAYLRLSYYYPDEVEPLVLELLRRPIPDGGKAWKLADKLQAIDQPDERRSRLKQILKRNGQAYREAIQERLFEEISSAHTREKNGIELNDDELRARRVLHETFDWPAEVTIDDWRKHPKSVFTHGEMAAIIRDLTHDKSKAIGQAVQSLLESERFKQDTYLVHACLTCLAARPDFADYLAQRLAQVDFSKDQQDLPADYLEAIAKSESPIIRKQLERIINTTSNPELFMVAAKHLTNTSLPQLLKRANEILDGLPPETSDGKSLLKFLIDKAPDEAEAILVNFLKPNSPSRSNTVCEALWYGHPLSQKVLLPLLEDTRPIPKVNCNVRERAAQALSHSIGTIKFDSDWPISQQDKAIEKMKAYCQQKK